MVQDYQTAISRNNPIPSSSSTSVAVALQTTEDNEDDYQVVTTSLRQIVREEHSLVDIEQQLVDEQKINHCNKPGVDQTVELATK